ncbi:prevent-host-death family protein [Labrys okinawensis]|uniref:prevent-host-death family protein n=1 Tax=Labrys okinawensis TaxID=346911 RepID=UPI0039BD03E3
MKILVEIDEVSERLEELIDLAARQNEIMICRHRRPIAALTSMDEVLRLAVEGPATVPADATSNHDDLYDNHGLPR